MLSTVARKVAARLGLAAVGGAVALAAMSGSSLAKAEAKPAATPAAAPAAGGDTVTKGRELFANFGCGSCHSLADASATGHVGPALDKNPNLTKAFVVDRVTNGQGPMPAFGGQLSPEEIADLADYITQVSAK